MIASTLLAQRVRTFLVFMAVALPLVIMPFLVVDARRIQFPKRTSAYHTRTEPAGIGARLERHNPARASAVDGAFSLKLHEMPKVGYDLSVRRALRDMGLTVDRLDLWIKNLPGTALSHVRYMPMTMQQYVASTAIFIRKSNPRIDEKTAWREAAALVHYSSKYGVPYPLTIAVAQIESTFDPNAVSSKGASGVMQVMWDLHQQLLRANGIRPTPGSNPLADPEHAIAAGCLLISRYLKACGSVQSALERYYGASSVSYQRKVNRNMASVMNHHSELFK
jgi:hypothetical protein